MKNSYQYRMIEIYYKCDIVTFATEALKMKLTPSQKTFLSEIQTPSSKVQSCNGGDLAGVVALWSLLFHRESVTRFATRSDNTATLRRIVWDQVSMCLPALSSKINFMANAIVIRSDRIYIKGYDKTWFIEVANSRSMMGCEQDLLWIDGDCGFDMNYILAGMTRPSNRLCVSNITFKD